MTKQLLKTKDKAMNLLKTMNKIPLLIIAIMAMSLQTKEAAAQEVIEVSKLTKDTKDTWHSFKKLGDVEMFYQYKTTGSADYVYFKLENHSNVKLAVLCDINTVSAGKVRPRGTTGIAEKLDARASKSDSGFTNFLFHPILVRELNRELCTTEITISNFKASISQ